MCTANDLFLLFIYLNFIKTASFTVWFFMNSPITNTFTKTYTSKKYYLFINTLLGLSPDSPFEQKTYEPTPTPLNGTIYWVVNVDLNRCLLRCPRASATADAGASRRDASFPLRMRRFTPAWRRWRFIETLWNSPGFVRKKSQLDRWHRGYGGI